MTLSDKDLNEIVEDGCMHLSTSEKQSMAAELQRYRNTADAILDLRASRDEWKADAERLASLVENERNAYDLMGCDGVKSITEEGYKKLECALNAHTVLVEKDKEGKWNELAKHVLDKNRGAWEELGKS
jgi:hypothetical protein